MTGIESEPEVGDPVADQAYYRGRNPRDLALNAGAFRAGRQVTELSGFSNDVEGQSAVFAYDLGTGALVTKAIIGTGDDPTLLNDLVVLDDGSVLVTDTDRDVTDGP